MNKKAEISLVMALVMIVSTFTLGTAQMNVSAVPTETITVEKYVWNETDGDWADWTEVNKCDIVTFKITVTYKSNCGNSYKETNISIMDILPPCLDYVEGSSVIEYGAAEEPGSGYVEQTDDTIWWNLSDEFEVWGPTYPDPDSVSIVFDAEVVDYTDCNGEENCVEVTAWETCCGQEVFGWDDALIIVKEPEELGISINKEIYDEDSGEYVEGPVTLYKGANIEFRVNVTNTGNVNLKDVLVTDVLPDFLNYDSASDSPSYDGDLNLTWTFDLDGGETKFLYVYMSVPEELEELKCGENFVNVTAVEPCCICDCEYLYDEDTLDICAKPHIVVEKKVKNEVGEWADKIDYVSKSEHVEFKITTTYYGEHTMKCLLVFDQLPDCLAYAETTSIKVAGEEISIEDIEIYIGDGETKEICNYEFTLSEGYIIWDWTNAELALKDGESVEIIFETEVTEYCTECDCQCCWDENCAMSILWGCCPCEHYVDCDCVDVFCCPPPTTFEKKVREVGDNVWEDSIETTVGESLEFKLELEYYGNRDLSHISVKDKLPCILEYDNNVDVDVIGGDAELDTVEISADGKSIWFNFTGNLSDGGKITIIFVANVIGSTGDCSECACACVNYAEITGLVGDGDCPPAPEQFFKDDSVDIKAESNCPPAPQGISGPSSGKTGKELAFKSTITDPDGDNILYKFKVNDEETGWLGPVSSGTEVTYKYTFDEEGTYTIKVKAKDEHGLESNWDTSLDIEITKAKGKNVGRFIEMIQNTVLYQLIQRLLEKFPALTTIFNI